MRGTDTDVKGRKTGSEDQLAKWCLHKMWCEFCASFFKMSGRNFYIIIHSFIFWPAFCCTMGGSRRTQWEGEQTKLAHRKASGWGLNPQPSCCKSTALHQTFSEDIFKTCRWPIPIEWLNGTVFVARPESHHRMERVAAWKERRQTKPDWWEDLGNPTCSGDIREDANSLSSQSFKNQSHKLLSTAAAFPSALELRTTEIFRQKTVNVKSS